MKLVFQLFLVAFITASLAGTVSAADTESSPQFVTQLIADYMAGNWDAVDASLKTNAREIAALPSSQRADVNTITSAFIECRQPWWKLCKAGNKIAIRPIVWSHPLDADYDPSGNGVSFNSTNGRMHYTISFSPADMDSTAKAEHGFTKGELGELGIWMGMGNADAWNMIPISSLQNLTDDRKTALTRFLDFRACVTGAYYGSPRARRWALFLYLNTYQAKYSQMSTQISREAVGAMFIHELFANAAKYPSIKLPASLPADGIEDKCAASIRAWIEKHPWTLHEDQSIREMLKQFASGNTGSAYAAELVRLPNNLLVSLDPEKDKALSVKRGEWIASGLQNNVPNR
jgi:hypothetical protein